MDAIRNRGEGGREGFVRLNAEFVEGAVLQELRKLLRTPETAHRTIAAVEQQDADVGGDDLLAALHDCDGLWDTLFPTEQARIARLLVTRVTDS